MAELSASADAGERGARWKWLLTAGGLLVLLGLAATGATTLLELTSLLVFGPLLLASSLIQLLIAFFAAMGKERFFHLAAACLEAGLGFLLMAQPLLVVSDLVLLVALFLMAIGLARMTRSLVLHSPDWPWALLAGGAALLLGLCVWLKLPVHGLWFVGLCIALDFICHGVSWSAIALKEWSPVQEDLP